MNQRQISVLTGASLVIMAVVAGAVMGVVYAPVFKMDLAEFNMQYAGLRTSLTYGLLGWVVILACDLVVSWGLYSIYRSVNTRKAAIMGLLRVGYSLILLVGIVQLIRAAMPSAETGNAFELLHSFESIWQFGLIVFGLHLLYLAPLVWVKGTIRMAISAALFIAGIGYVLSNSLDLVIADYEQIRSKVEAVFILPMVLGEVGLAIWLLVKGDKQATSVK